MGLSDSFKSLKKDKMLFTIISICVVFIIIAVIYKIYSVLKTGSELVAQQTAQAIVAAQTGISVERQNACQQIATACENACNWTWDWIPFFGGDAYHIDGDIIVQALGNVTSDDEMRLVSFYFQKDRGYSLKKVVDSFHSGIKPSQIQYYSSVQ